MSEKLEILVATIRAAVSPKNEIPETQSPKSRVEVALPSSSTYCTLVGITRNVFQTVLDAIVHNILQKQVSHGIYN